MVYEQYRQLAIMSFLTERSIITIPALNPYVKYESKFDGQQLKGRITWYSNGKVTNAFDQNYPKK